MTDAEGSAADRLEKALKQHEERSKREPLTPDQVRMRVFLARVEKLPPAERKQVLEDAGLKFLASRVGIVPGRRRPPLPESRVSGSGRISAMYERIGVEKDIDWTYWSMIPAVPLWMAVALSLNRNPGEMSGNRHAHRVREVGYIGRVFGEECARRLDIAIANLSASGPFAPTRLYSGAVRDPNVTVTMHGFRQFVHAMAKPWTIPDSFPAPAEHSHTNAVVPKESTADRRARRLSRLRALGADLSAAGDGWQLVGTRGALETLADEEVAAGRQMSSRPDVRRDLNAAMEAEKKQMR